MIKQWHEREQPRVPVLSPAGCVVPPPQSRGDKFVPFVLQRRIKEQQTNPPQLTFRKALSARDPSKEQIGK